MSFVRGSSLEVLKIGCPSCGFSYCNKCLKYKCDIPNVGVKKVCGCCHNKLNNMKKSSPEASTSDTSSSDISKEPLAPIDITMKLDSLENPARPPVVIYKHTNPWDQFKKGLEPADQEIVDRLQKLKNKEQNIPLPSVDEIKRRLALLKDQDPEANGNSNVMNIHQVDTRTDQEKMDDLIQEYLELSATNDPCKEIQEKLNSLRDERDKTNVNESKKGIDDDEEKVTKKLINKALAEAMLEAKYEKEELKDVEAMDSEIPNRSEDEDEKPTCVMCEQTADLVQCMGCTGDLYCPVCFEGNHDEFEKHKTIRYQPTKMSFDD
ncbi:abscission/NoCut checkpoint regulator isoform X2 [Odontomachus brunneus]|uniref:abscission/NoCut checkpoint regulator isoform X2 n=1 Tax=Odontomachus brunneus TaxID=486640 RepID=UPI0013F1A91E|nr:abscission/NoCut checkpoint regulator isoform X2 [Odontomachus brunneus]